MSHKFLPTRARLRTASAALIASASVLSLGAAAGSAHGPAAVTSRTISLNDSSHLHEVGHHGLKVDEEGSASGTVKGKIYIHLNLSSTNRVSAEINIYPSNGSLTGTASARYEVRGPTANFSGTMSIIRGTGRYKGAHGSGLSFSGTVRRGSNAVTVRVSGNLST